MKTQTLKAIIIMALGYWGMTLSPAVLAGLTPPVAFNTANNIPLETSGNGIVANKQWAIILGKALFWDMQAGSDKQSCGTCHFSAGADSRIRNQLSPGFLQKPVEDKSFGSKPDYDGEFSVLAQSGLTRSQAQNGNANPLDATYLLLEDDFPLHHLADNKDRNSGIMITTNDSVSSSGAHDAVFRAISRVNSSERCAAANATIFHGGVLAARQVEPRNTPTVINAAFSFLNLWDGRANHNFNGVDPFGKRTLDPVAGDPDNRLVVLDDSGVPVLGSVSVEHASLASQAVNPPLSTLEMSCSGKTFPDHGRKMMAGAIRPLQLQTIDPNDSVFGVNGPQGNLIHSSGKGLSLSYAELIKLAFEDKYWKADKAYGINNGQLLITDTVTRGFYTQIERNFSLFWGLAIQMYETTLVSSQTPFDTWFAQCRPIVSNPASTGANVNIVPIKNPLVQCRGANSLVADPAINPATLTPGFGATEVLGFGMFNNGGVGVRDAGSTACVACHFVTFTNFTSSADPQFRFPLFTEAQFEDGQIFIPVERSRIDSRGPGTPTLIEGAGHDRGFFNTGVTPTSFDLGNGATDPYGSPLSLARMFIAEQAGETVTDPSGVLTSTGVLTTRCNTNATVLSSLIEAGDTPLFPGCPSDNPPLLNKTQERDIVDGSFKVPTLRNIALTPPYFHNGGISNLREVVEFYVRGGNRRDKSLVDGGFTGDTTGTGPLGTSSIPVTGTEFGSNVHFFIRDIKSTEEQIDAIVAFLKTLTDESVRCDAGVFDHPELLVSNGHTASDANRDRKADDIIATVPAVGAGGYIAAGRPELCLPNSGNLFDANLRNRLIQ